MTQNQPENQAVIPRPKEFGWAGAFVAMLSALLLAMNEVSVLSAGFVLERGTPSSFSEMSGLSAFPEWEHWDDVFTGTQLENWRDLLAFYLLLDIVFVATYAAALLLLLSHVPSAPRWGRRVAVAGVIGLAVVDLLENGGQFWLAAQRGDAGGVGEFPSSLVGWMTGLKWALTWLLLGTGVVVSSVSLFRHASVRRRVGHVFWALWIQRYSLLVFLPIAALALLPLDRLNNLFGQLPDVQRAWLDGWIGVWHFVAAGLVFSVVAYGIFALGRIRSDWAARRAAGSGYWPFRDQDGTPRLPRWGLWLAGPTLLLVLAIFVWLLDVAGSGGQVFLWRLFGFCLPPLLVVGFSRWLKKRGETKAAAKLLPTRSAAWAETVMAVGDVLAVTAVSLAGLGMVRAFTGLFALGRSDLLQNDYLVAPGVAWVSGLSLAVVPWLLSGPVLSGLHESRPEVDDRVAAPAWYPQWARDALSHAADGRGGVSRVLVPGYDTSSGPEYTANEDPGDVFRLGLLILAIVAFFLLAGFPRPIAYGLGALGAVTLALGALLGMLGVLVAYAQDRQPMQVFTAIGRFTASPIGLVLVAAIVISALVPVVAKKGESEIHAVTGTGAVPPRPHLKAAFTDWLAQPDVCSVTYAADDAFRIRPMLLLAAEGGGMRAMYWTAATLQTISTAGTKTDDDGIGCGARAALLSGGASGGALGLTVGRFSNRPRDLVEQMAGPNALAAASVSLASGDLLASLAGIRFPVHAAHRDPEWQGLDRAGLMEITWEREAELAPLRTQFVPTDPTDATGGAGSVTGQLILTATEAHSGCHALLSQVDLNGAAAFGGPRAACGQGVAGDNAYDVLAAYGRSSAQSEESCLGNPPALSAGLIASRFPYVTPSAVLGQCRELEPTQLIDGGYSDNTGLGTIVGLADTWTALVRDHNDAALVAGSGELVVPMVVFMDNGSPNDYRRPSTTDLPAQTRRSTIWESRPIPELLVPPLGGWIAKPFKVSPRYRLAQARDHAAESLCSPTTEGCDELGSSPDVAQQVFVVHQSNQPSMPAPLGWVLSEASQHDLDTDISQQANRGMAELPNDPASAAGYGSLHDLLAELGLAEGE